MYSVNLWGSKPGENDDCWSGYDFKSKEEALAVFERPWGRWKGFDACRRSTAFIELDGPDIHKTRANPDFDPNDRDDDDDWRREIAMQQGMAFGCEGYNEVMGWD